MIARNSVIVPETVGPEDAELAAAMEAYLAAREAGKAVDLEWIVAQHPAVADRLRACIASLEVVEGAAGQLLPPAEGEKAELGCLGDFRLIREVGRGGMGVVYEAEQISLRRQVALKVLPFAATMDPRQLQRFHNEARAAASLHHEHIVPVFAVGCERGVHYYAMQFIDGQSLAELIARRVAPGSGDPTTPHVPAPPGAYTRPQAADATRPAPRDAAFFRRVAQWGVEAAEALEHAHSMGIVHRDVKPGNLMIDAAGKLWVADFGLARSAADIDLTMSGDVIGTLRYMSPEQALARHGLVDHRTDIYALGATLYELLSGRPAVEGKDRAELLHRITFGEPAQPRRHNRAIPVDLETVVLTCLAKEPEVRYASAAQLAADLQRFLDGQPVQARRPALAARAWSWAWRHRTIAAFAAVATLVVALTSLASAVYVTLAYREKNEQWLAAEKSRQAAERSAEAEKKATARAEAQRAAAEGHLRNAVRAWGESFEVLRRPGAPSDTPELAALRRKPVENARQFFQGLLSSIDEASRPAEAALIHHEIGRLHFLRDDVATGQRSYARAVALYRQLLVQAPNEARYRADLNAAYRELLIRANLVVNEDMERSLELRAERSLAATRMHALVPAGWGEKVTASGAMSRLFVEPTALLQAGEALHQLGRSAEAEPLFGRGADLWRTLPDRYPRQVWQPICRLGEARALLGRGLARTAAGRAREAEGDYRRALALYAAFEPSDVQTLNGYSGLGRLEGAHGNLLWARGEKAAAAAAFRRAEASWRKFDLAGDYSLHADLAFFLATCPDPAFRRPADALARADKAIRIRPAEGRGWLARGVALSRVGRQREAAVALEEAVKRPGRTGTTARLFLAMAHWRLGDNDKARSWYGKAVAWMDKHKPQDAELLRFRAEAAALLGIQDKVKPKPD